MKFLFRLVAACRKESSDSSTASDSLSNACSLLASSSDRFSNLSTLSTDALISSSNIFFCFFQDSCISLICFFLSSSVPAVILLILLVSWFMVAPKLTVCLLDSARALVRSSSAIIFSYLTLPVAVSFFRFLLLHDLVTFVHRCLFPMASCFLFQKSCICGVEP